MQLQEAFGNILNKSSNMMKKILSFMLCSKILPVYKCHSKSPLEAAAASHNFIIKDKKEHLWAQKLSRTVACYVILATTRRKFCIPEHLLCH